MNKQYKTQCSQILNYMRTHKRGITPIIAEQKFQCHRLSGRIFDLRERGYDIETVIQLKKNDQGRTIQYAEYLLHE